MNNLTDLREVVDVVIGVDTHVHTHSAAVIDAAAGGALDEITVGATAQGYAELVSAVAEYTRMSPLTYAADCKAPTLIVEHESVLRCPMGPGRRSVRRVADVRLHGGDAAHA